jgi:ribosomal protein S15P/S13E
MRLTDADGFTEVSQMDYVEKLERLNNHIARHPKDYQSVIARMKCYSDAVEHEMYLKRVERLKKVAMYRRLYGN